MVELQMNVVDALQASIAPVTLISGVGFLSLVTSNRYGRVIDRIRTLLRQIYITEDKNDQAMMKEQVDILYRRANRLRVAAVLGGSSIFCTGLTIFLIFAKLMFNLPLAHFAEFSFLLSLALLLCFTTIFIHDFGIALGAVKFEINYHLEKQASSSRDLLNLLPSSEEP